jgi:hypothetical protein
MNAYADVATFKSAIWADIETITEQVWFRHLLEEASRYIDNGTHRAFFCWEGIKYYDGKYDNLRIDDVVSVSQIRLDEDSDDAFEAVMAGTDYLLTPYNQLPKEELKLSNSSTFSGLADGVRRGIEITGVHGYGDGESATPYYLTGQTVQDNPLAAGATTVTVSATTTLGAGMTLRIDSEQLYIASITNATTFVVERGVNGTAAANHALNAPVSLYAVPAPINVAALTLALRVWKRKDSAFQDIVGTAETGIVVTSKDEDPMVRTIMSKYFRRA